MDVDGLILACATRTEARSARRLGAPVVLVGVGARRRLPDGPAVSFGLCGALDEGIEVGEVVDAVRVVDEAGRPLWEGSPLGAPGARRGTIVAVARLVDSPGERRRLRERTGADAADLESGPLARAGCLRGVLRAVSDTPARPLGPLAGALGPDGRLAWRGLARAAARPRASARALADVRRALRSLEALAP